MKDANILTKKCTLIALLIFLVFLSNNVLASIGSLADDYVEIEDDRISIQVNGIKLGKLLNEIEKKVEIKFKLEESLSEEKVSASFSGLSLPEGLKKVLYPLNYFFVHGQGGKISKVFIVDQGKASSNVARAIEAEVLSTEIHNSPPMEAYEKSGGPPGSVSTNRDDVQLDHLTQSKDEVPSGSASPDRDDVPPDHVSQSKGEVPSGSASVNRDDVPTSDLSQREDDVPHY